MWHDKRVKRRRPTKTARFSQVNTEDAPKLYRRLAPVLHGVMTCVAKRDWDDFGALPEEGPAIIVANHLSSFDALPMADYVLYHGRYPYFLGKSGLWKVPVLGRLLRGIDQIPVHRGTGRAADSLVEAHRKLDDGKIVFIFAEGTTCRDPQLWPFASKTGAARLALSSGVPVIPVGHWGTSTICPDNAGPQTHPYLFPRHWLTFRSGPPVDLAAFGRSTTDREMVRAASVAIMEAIVPLVEAARGETAPPLRWNPKTQSYVPPAEAVW